MLATPTPTGKANEADFAQRIVAWQRCHGRHDLPWQGSRDPYRIWLAEIMLQQTQVATVVPYYLRFVGRYGDVRALAAAPSESVMALWAGLGYYARARNLLRAAQQVMTGHGGVFPTDPAALQQLPGIGRSTAGAIAAFAANARAAILDGNVKRVLTRHFGVAGFPGRREVEAGLWTLAERLLPDAAAMPAYTQGLMDLGATLCLRGQPVCPLCPLATSCVAHREARTTELPTPRPRKAVPRRQCRLLVIFDGARVLLEERPPAGIWGGLLSLPELDASEADLAAAVALRCGSPPLQLRALEAVGHAFTHFHLTLTPLLARVAPPFTLARDSRQRWLALDALASAPLPAPVRRLLARLPKS